MKWRKELSVGRSRQWVYRLLVNFCEVQVSDSAGGISKTQKEKPRTKEDAAINGDDGE